MNVFVVSYSMSTGHVIDSVWISEEQARLQAECLRWDDYYPVVEELRVQDGDDLVNLQSEGESS